MIYEGAVALSVKVQNLRFCGTPLYRYVEFAGIHTDPSFASEGTASPKLAVRSDDRPSQTGGLSACRNCSPHSLLRFIQDLAHPAAHSKQLKKGHAATAQVIGCRLKVDHPSN